MRKDDLQAVDSVAADLVLSSFQVDFLVKNSTAFAKSAWVWRQFIVHGDQLTVVDARLGVDAAVATVPVPHCALMQAPPTEPCHPSTTYLLLDTRKPSSPVLTLSIPSATRLAKFQAILRVAATTPYWVHPAPSSFQDLVEVAKCIVETHQATPQQLSATPSIVTKDDVASYVQDIQHVYNRAIECTTKQQFLHFLEQLQADYIANREPSSVHSTLAHHVHRLYPSEFKKFDRARITSACFQLPMAACPHPHCNVPLSIEETFRMRVFVRTTKCHVCHNILSTDTFRIAQFLRDVPTFSVPLSDGSATVISMPLLPHDGTRSTYMRQMARALYWTETQSKAVVSREDKQRLDTTLASYLDSFDLVPAMAHHLHFMAPICANLAYWTDPTVLEASVVRYDQFRHMSRHSSIALVPTTDIALVQVVHQRLDGTLPQLDPPTTPQLAHVAYADTFLAWSDLFNEAYSSYVPDFGSWMAAKAKNPIQRASLKKKWAKLVRVPSWNCRFVGVDEPYVDDSVPCATAVQDSAPSQARQENVAVVIAPALVAVIGTPTIDDRVHLASPLKTFQSDANPQGKRCLA